MAQFGIGRRALDALPGLARAGGRAQPPARAAARRTRNARWSELAALGGWMVFAGDADYPPLLALLPDPPPMLSRAGRRQSALVGQAIGLVGARNASANGQRMADVLATDLALRPASSSSRAWRAASMRRRTTARWQSAAPSRGRRRARPPLSARARRPAGAHRGARRRGHRGAARHGAAKPAFPTAQPDHRRPVARPGRGGGGAAVRQPDHRAAWPRKPTASCSPCPARRSIRAAAARTT